MSLNHFWKSTITIYKIFNFLFIFKLSYNFSSVNTALFIVVLISTVTPKGLVEVYKVFLKLT